MKLPNPFARLLGLQRTADARERLHALRGKYALTENDPIWELVSVLEDFCADLRAESHSERTIGIGAQRSTQHEHK